MISVKVISDSKFNHRRVTTFELEYPRYIHAELMTHRVFSRNAASSRAIPVSKLIELVETQTVMPIWTYNQSGMQGKRVTSGSDIHKFNSIWLTAARHATETAKLLSDAGAHKQNVNRILEPFQHIKVVVTASDFENFFNLRCHPDAQPEIQVLAMEMQRQYLSSNPKQMKNDEDWHLPYADSSDDVKNLSLQDRKMISASCCAQVSYRNTDDSLEKAKDIFARLASGDPIHASPFEHQVTWGKNHSRGNLHGLHQLRQDIEDAGKTK